MLGSTSILSPRTDPSQILAPTPPTQPTLTSSKQLPSITPLQLSQRFPGTAMVLKNFENVAFTVDGPFPSWKTYCGTGFETTDGQIIPHGTGTLTYGNGAIYQGKFNEGQRIFGNMMYPQINDYHTSKAIGPNTGTTDTNRWVEECGGYYVCDDRAKVRSDNRITCHSDGDQVLAYEYFNRQPTSFCGQFSDDYFAEGVGMYSNGFYQGSWKSYCPHGVGTRTFTDDTGKATKTVKGSFQIDGRILDMTEYNKKGLVTFRGTFEPKTVGYVGVWYGKDGTPQFIGEGGHVYKRGITICPKEDRDPSKPLTPIDPESWTSVQIKLGIHPAHRYEQLEQRVMHPELRHQQREQQERLKQLASDRCKWLEDYEYTIVP